MDMGFLGDLGDFIGGVAVVGSLLYVGLQVRQSNELTGRSRSALSRAITTLF